MAGYGRPYRIYEGYVCAGGCRIGRQADFISALILPSHYAYCMCRQSVMGETFGREVPAAEDGQESGSRSGICWSPVYTVPCDAGKFLL